MSNRIDPFVDVLLREGADQLYLLPDEPVTVIKEGKPRKVSKQPLTDQHIYALLVDAESGRTLASVSTRSKALAEGLSSTGNVEAAKRVGKAIAELAREKRIDEVVFNRNGFLYHGRVKALAEAAREAGLRF
jgi:large subunit ribosomal protein L18